jgi:hypothetical protein
MIDEELNIKEYNKNYNNLTIRTEINLICDYCGIKFKRIKKSIQRLNKIICKDSCGNKSCTAKKKEEINIKIHGTNNYFESKEFLEKSKKTNLDKYGSENYFSSDDFKNKRSKSLIAKYGADSPLKNEEIKNKQKSTCLEKYGVENFSKTKDFIEKRERSCLEKYGHRSAMQNDKVKKKKEKTCKKKYGKKNYTQTKEYWQKRIETCLKKYGVEHPHQNKNVFDKMTKTLLDKYGVKCFSKHSSFKEKMQNTCMDKYGVKSPFLLPENRPNLKTQNAIKDWLNSYGFNFNSNFIILEGKELDLYDEDKKFAIEYCGIYWHNENSLSPKLRSYHYDKYKKCKDNGIQLLTIFDDEWNNKQNVIKSVILSKLGIFSKRVYARKCETKEISKKEMNDFCEQYHVQGKNSLSLVCFGLFYENELVGVVDLGRHHRKKEKETLVLTRLCFKEGYQIVGGSSKLFNCCINYCKENNIKNIISWSDNRWSDGKIYKNLGFVLEEDLGPDYCYVDISNPKKRISKQSQKKSNSNCPENTSELEWANYRGLSRIWDCGKTRWNYLI